MEDGRRVALRVFTYRRLPELVALPVTERHKKRTGVSRPSESSPLLRSHLESVFSNDGQLRMTFKGSKRMSSVGTKVKKRFPSFEAT